MMTAMKTIASVNAPKNVGIWIRVSTEDQAQGESPEHHLERGKAYAVARGWSVKEVYDLAGVSGKSVKDHPEAQRMLKDIKSGHIAGLIFSKLARLARNTKELLEFSDYFREHDADLISVSETIDTSTPAGRLFFTIIAAMAQWEREEIADRVKASVAIRAKLGKSINGRAPYGYHWVNQKLVPHPDEAPIRRQVYELFLKHRRKGTVAKLLNVAGYRTRNGKLWRDMHVARTLSDPSAKGVYYFNRFSKHDTKARPTKPESEWGKTDCQPIIPEELWTQVNEITEEQLKSWKKPGPVPVQLLGNIAYCICGHKMYVRSGTPKYVCRKCHNKISIVDLEGVVYDELKAFFANPEQIAEHLSATKHRLSEKEIALQTHQREIQKVRDEMTRTHKLYVDGEITAQGFGTFYRPAEERLNQLTSALPKLQAEVDLLRVNNVSGDEVLAEAQTIYPRWPKMTIDEKRPIVQALIEKVIVGKGEVELSFSYAPTSEELCKSQQQLRGAG